MSGIMSLVEQKSLRGRVTNQEALEERASKLFKVPTELSVADFNKLSADSKLLYPPPLVNGKHILNKPVSALTVKERYDILKDLEVANGIKLVFVESLDVPAGEAHLEVQFFNRNYLETIVTKFDTEHPTDPQIASRIFSISGGHRLPAGSASGQVQVTEIAKSPNFNSTQPTTLDLTIKPIGDYSTYTLSVNTIFFPPANPVIIDPVFNEIDFKFRPGCFNINCAPDWKPGVQASDEPVIDYLAKDYDSFRHTMITAMMRRVPEWQTSSEADLDQVLLDLFSAAADELSDYQDRVMNEAYLSSARKRVSLARHARLMDYHIHQGNQASTLLALEVDAGAPLEFDLQPGLQVWAGVGKKDDATSVVFVARNDDAQHVHKLLNQLGLYTWGDSVPSLLAGDTTADLQLFLNGTPVTDKASAIAVQQVIREEKIKYLLIQEHLNPATGSINGFNQDKRQLLRLVAGANGAEAFYDPTTAPPGYDPVTDTPAGVAKWFVRVRWDEKDKLQNN